MQKSSIESIYRKQWFWAALSLLTLGAAFFSVKYLPVMCKEVSIDLKMSRSEAIKTAAELSQKHSWLPLEAQSATHFSHDEKMQYYVDLECGGHEAFTEIIKNGLYQPYTWTVRRFKEFSPYETFVAFTPQGKLYGFYLKIPENDEKHSLSSVEARKEASQFASSIADINLDDYEEYETSKQKHPNGRVTHSFVYQRKQEHLGKEGRYRLRLEVDGNQVSKLEHFVHVPESFLRRYQEMRTGNEAITYGAHTISMILFFFLGGLFGGFLLFRKKLLLYKNAFFWATLLSLLYVLSTLNKLPLLWMEYNTAMPMSSFLMNIIAQLCLVFFQLLFKLIITFAVGESLTRVAFKEHVQFWKIWEPKVACSFPIAGQTVASYCLAVVKIAWCIIVYLFLTRVIRWWTPGSPLVDPNIVATYQPWLEALTMSLFAGFREECLFRAIPIAGSILVGRYFKKERLGLIIGVLLQALLFPAVHANYTTYPSYFRIVEMMPTTFFYAFIYIVYGLFPAVIIHWIYDLILMSLGVFIGHGTALLFSKILVIGLGALPLIITTYYRWEKGHFTPLSKDYLNGTWKPSHEEIKNQTPFKTKITTLPSSIHYLLLALSIIGIVSSIKVMSFKNYAPSMSVSKEQARKESYSEMKELNEEFLNESTTFSMIIPIPEKESLFVWEELGKEIYESLMGNYLNPPLWCFRFVHLDGPLVERAEEFHIYIDSHNNVKRITHILPESREGAALSKEEARKKALDFIYEEYSLKKEQVKEISALDSQKLNRRDWLFTFEDTTIPLEKGSARLLIGICGDEICDYKQFVHVPEDYIRLLEKRDSYNKVIEKLSLILLVFLSILGAGRLFSTLTATHSFTSFGILFIIVGMLSLINLANQLPLLIFTFNTAQSFKGQMIMLLGAITPTVILRVIFSVILIMNTLISQPKTLIKRTFLTPLLGISSGIILYGLTLYGKQYALPFTPQIAEYDALSAYSVWLCMLYPLILFLRYTGFLILLTRSLKTMESYRYYTFTRIFFLTAAAFACLGFLSVISIQSFLISGILLTIGLIFLYSTLFQKDISLIPLCIATIMALQALYTGSLHAYSASYIVGCTQALLLLGTSFLWFRKIQPYS